MPAPRRLAALSVVPLVLGLVAAAGPAVASPGAWAASARIEVDAGRSLGPSNQHLGGVGWNTGSLEGVRDITPPSVRIDAALEQASPAPGVLDLGGLLARVAAVRAVGAEPLVILDYTPAWLGAPCAAGRDPTRVAPCDLDAWQALVHDVVSALATAPAPAYRFEVWNEPDLPIFWLDTEAAFLATATRTHRAVASVAAETGLPLVTGGPATAFPDPAWIIPYQRTLTAAGLAPAFVSWHYYANYPFLGPDGAEGTIPAPLLPAYPLAGRRNPLATPMDYGVQTQLVRAWTAGPGPAPQLVIDEWNLSAGGFDRRHDTNEAAAFDLATLVEMERAGLDAADVYRAADDPRDVGRVGDWGLVDATGAPKPPWWVFRAWARTSGDRLVARGDDPASGLWARATRRAGRLDVLLAAFDARGGTDRTVDVVLEGACARRARVAVLSGPDGTLGAWRPAGAVDGRVRVTLPRQSVAWVRYSLEGCGG